jgi:hypothetical protein
MVLQHPADDELLKNADEEEEFGTQIAASQ